MLKQLVQKTIARYCLLEGGDTVLIGVSGGPDSVALLHVLGELSSILRLKIGVAHVNHQIREEAVREEDFVRLLAKKFDLPFYSQRVDVPEFCRQQGYSLEEGGRIKRYAFLEETAETHHYIKIAVGHNYDDNAEQVLMNLFRGTGPAGISGIPPKRNKIIRPLIQVPRTQIIQYLTVNNYQCIQDSSNYDMRFLRNRIRHKVIPVIQECCHPKVTQALNRCAELMRSEESWLNEMVQAAYHESLLDSPLDQVWLSMVRLKTYSTALTRRVIRTGIYNVKGDLRTIGAEHIEMALGILHDRYSALDLPQGVRIYRKDNILIFCLKASPRNTRGIKHKSDVLQYHYQVSKPCVINIVEIRARLNLTEFEAGLTRDKMAENPQIAFMDRDRVDYPLVIRNYQPGDRFSPLGLSGTQTLKHFFSYRKVSAYWRKHCPLVICRGRIIWVAGMRIDNSVKITDDTKQILMIELSIDHKQEETVC